MSTQPQRPFGTGLFGSPPKTPQSLGQLRPINPVEYMDPASMAQQKMGLAGMAQIDPNASYQRVMQNNLQNALAKKDYTASAGQQLGALLSSALGGANPYGGMAEVGNRQLQALETNIGNELDFKDAQQQQMFDVVNNFLVNQGVSPDNAQALAFNPGLEKIVSDDSSLYHQQRLSQERLNFNKKALKERQELQKLNLVARAQENQNRQAYNQYKDNRDYALKVDALRNKVEAKKKDFMDNISKNPRMLQNSNNVRRFSEEFANELSRAKTTKDAFEIFTLRQKSIISMVDTAVSKGNMSKDLADHIKKIFDDALNNNPELAKELAKRSPVKAVTDPLSNLLKGATRKISTGTGAGKQLNKVGNTLDSFLNMMGGR